MRTITRLVLTSLIVTTLAPIYAGDCKEKENSPKSIAAHTKRVVTEDDVYAQKPAPKNYPSTIAGACNRASDELATCNTALLTITHANASKQLEKVPLMQAFMQAEKLYTSDETPYTYSTDRMPELFARIAPKLLASNQTTENNNAYTAIKKGVKIELKTLTHYKGSKIIKNYRHNL